jgi:hypothetical protein
MTVLASVPVPLREIAPVDFVPIVALLVLLVEREIIRTRPGAQTSVTYRVMDFAIFPLVFLFLIFVCLRAVTFLG